MDVGRQIVAVVGVERAVAVLVRVVAVAVLVDAVVPRLRRARMNGGLGRIAVVDEVVGAVEIIIGEPEEQLHRARRAGPAGGHDHQVGPTVAVHVTHGPPGAEADVARAGWEQLRRHLLNPAQRLPLEDHLTPGRRRHAKREVEQRVAIEVCDAEHRGGEGLHTPPKHRRVHQGEAVVDVAREVQDAGLRGGIVGVDEHQHVVAAILVQVARVDDAVAVDLADACGQQHRGPRRVAKAVLVPAGEGERAGDGATADVVQAHPHQISEPVGVDVADDVYAGVDERGAADLATPGGVGGEPAGRPQV